MRKLALIPALAVLIAASAALAGTPVALKSDAFASGPVTLGDVFDGAGRAGATVIGPAAQPGSNIVLDAGAVQRAARVAGLEWDNASGIRRIIVRGEVASAAPVASAQKSGAMAQVLTYAHNLNAGDIVRAEDLTWGEVPAFQAGAPVEAEALIGKAAKKPLRAGAAANGRDVSMPQVIKKDDVVQVSYRAGGITLTLQGKALEAAVLGEPFSVQNAASKKVIDAVATGPGRAVVGPEADRIRTQSAPTLATPSLVSLR